jgi:hypothetical protein
MNWYYNGQQIKSQNIKIKMPYSVLYLEMNNPNKCWDQIAFFFFLTPGLIVLSDIYAHKSYLIWI